MEREVSIGDCRVFVDERGEGSPVLFVPDNVAATAWMYRGVQDRLPNRRTFAVDLPGIGRSQQPDGYDYSFGNLADGCLRLLDELGLDRVDYVGHGRAGGIGQILAHRAPERLRTLTLISTVAYDYWPIIEMRSIGALKTQLETLGPLLPALGPMMASTLTNLWRCTTGRRGVLTNPVLERYCGHFLTPQGMLTLISICADAKTEEVSSLDPRAIRLPTLILWGDRDEFFPESWGEELWRDIPDAELRILRDGGFLLVEEDPAGIASTLNAFLSKIEARGQSR